LQFLLGGYLSLTVIPLKTSIPQIMTFFPLAMGMIAARDCSYYRLIFTDTLGEEI
jgi:hypothetical protein